MWYLHLPFNLKKYQKNNARNVARIRRQDTVTVVFFASNVAMWRYQGLYEEMRKNPRYKAYIVLSPLNAAYTNDQKRAAIESLRKHFDSNGVEYIDYDTVKMKGYDIKSLNPDILFYPQPYFTIMGKEHRYCKFKDCLLCYYPYGFYYQNIKSFYDDDYQCRAWKLFHENEASKEGYRMFSPVGDSNVEVVGYPNADLFATSSNEVWKPQDRKKKRIIWAPHFTILDDGWAQNSEFLRIAELMVELRDKRKDKLQFAFKPHPRLMTELYKHPDWGKERTDAFYNGWAKSENSQLETGDYIDLFVGSDAMIHDSGSFAAEYMYTGNPVLYTVNNMKRLYECMNSFGALVMDNHYHGGKKEDVLHFIDEVVMNGDDPKKEERMKMREQYLMPPNGKTVAQNTMDILNKELSK